LEAMPKGKPWSAKDEKQLRKMVEENKQIKEIAAFFGKSGNAIRQKMRRLGLKVVEHPPLPPLRTTTSKLENSEELIPVQKALEILAAALKASGESGLDAIEIQRLNVVATLARTYENLFARFMQYREIEKRVVELEAKYARLAKEES